MIKIKARSLLPPICTTCGAHVLGALTLAVRANLPEDSCAICSYPRPHRAAA